MEPIELELNTLHRLDNGKASAAFRQCLREIVRDCMERPGDDRAREVIMTLRAIPKTEQSGEAIRVTFQIIFKTKVPALQTTEYDGLANMKGHLRFQPDSPDDVNQSTLDLDDDKSREGKP